MDTYCKHLRIRGYRDQDTDLEKFITILQKQYEFDFTSLPEWKKLIQTMNVAQSEYKQKHKEAAKREFKIIENLQNEFTRLSPFELTDRLARTAKKWELLKNKERKCKTDITEQDIVLLRQEPKNDLEYLVEESDVISTAHPNTAVIQSVDVLVTKPDIDSDIKSMSSPQLPISVFTNQHKKLSPIVSKYSALTYIGDKPFGSKSKSVSIKDDIVCWNEIKAIQITPNELTLDKDTNKQQMLKLHITNCSTEFLYLRFKRILDPSYFKSFTIIPATTVKLYPGLTFPFKVVLKLKKYVEATAFKSSLCYKLGRNVLLEAKEDMLFHVPIVVKDTEDLIVTVTETVNIPPAYNWHVSGKSGYPRGLGYVYINGNPCHMHIRKRDVSYYLDDNIDSLEAISPDSESLILRQEDMDQDVQNEALLSQKTLHNDEMVNNEEIIINTFDIVTVLLDDVVDLALQPFVFKHTYLRLLPKCKRIFQIYFTKPNHVGFHNAYYDFEFLNLNTDEVMMTKTIKVFAEVLPNPIIIEPQILDMRRSPVTFGYSKDYFTIINTHKSCPVTVKIKTTTKMQRIFKIIPMKTFIAEDSRANFEVGLCLRNGNTENNFDELSYFTIKIIIYGDKTIYRNSPPMFYEIIVPCAKEFKRVYGKTYFRDISESEQYTT